MSRSSGEAPGGWASAGTKFGSTTPSAEVPHFQQTSNDGSTFVPHVGQVHISRFLGTLLGAWCATTLGSNWLSTRPPAWRTSGARTPRKTRGREGDPASVPSLGARTKSPDTRGSP